MVAELQMQHCSLIQLQWETNALTFMHALLCCPDQSLLNHLCTSLIVTCIFPSANNLLVWKKQFPFGTKSQNIPLVCFLSTHTGMSEKLELLMPGTSVMTMTSFSKGAVSKELIW